MTPNVTMVAYGILISGLQPITWTLGAPPGAKGALAQLQLALLAHIFVSIASYSGLHIPWARKSRILS